MENLKFWQNSKARRNSFGEKSQKYSIHHRIIKINAQIGDLDTLGNENDLIKSEIGQSLTGQQEQINESF